MRNAGQIGAALDAEVTLYVDTQSHSRLQPLASELRFFFITSELTLEKADVATEGAHAVALEGAEVLIAARPSEHAKCTRCWHHRPDVGSHKDHPEICGR